MGFTGINEQNKQRVNILPGAYSCIKQDVRDFNLKNVDTLINKVLRYNERHSLTTEMHLKKYISSLSADLTDMGIGNELEMITDAMYEREVQRIKKLNDSNPTHRRNQAGFYMRISNEVRRWLESDINTENEYYLSLEQYINAQIELYAHKSNYERESIIFDDIISQLNGYIKESTWLDVYYREPTTVHRIFPITVDSDRLNTHAYLACYRLVDRGKIVPITYRITSLPADIRPIEYDDAVITDDMISRMSDFISERGIQFLAFEPVDIDVRLTSSGIKSYERTLPLRPDCKKAVRHDDREHPERSWAVYSFYCTEKQAEYYFLKFGKDAEILSPDSLRNRFKAAYEETLHIYKD